MDDSTTVKTILVNGRLFEQHSTLVFENGKWVTKRSGYRPISPLKLIPPEAGL